jgi:hypothetical protein
MGLRLDTRTRALSWKIAVTDAAFTRCCEFPNFADARKYIAVIMSSNGSGKDQSTKDGLLKEKPAEARIPLSWWGMIN